MKHLYLLVLAFIIHTGSYAQPFSKPDYQSIEQQVTDINSPLNYKKLLTRYHAGDSTLGPREYTHLYYGSFYSGTYSPYAISKHAELIKPILAKTALDPEDLNKLIEIEHKLLLDMPFSIRNLNILAYAYSKKGDNAAAIVVRKKLYGIISAIMATGDGKSAETAFHVVSVDSEYDILPALGFKFGGKQSLINKCDYLELAPNDKQQKGIYFDVSAMFNETAKLLKK